MMICPYCREEITDTDTIKTMDSNVFTHCCHSECVTRNLIGGLNHLKRLCSCYGGTEPPDPPEMTNREAAKAAVSYWEELNEPRR